MLFNFRAKKLQGQYAPSSSISVRSRRGVVANVAGPFTSQFGSGSGGGSGYGGGMGGGAGNFGVSRYSGTTQSMELGNITQEWMPKDPVGLHTLWRQIYGHCSVAGPTLDLISNFLISNYNLIGMKDPGHLELFEAAMQNLQAESILSPIAREFMMIGHVSGNFLFDDTIGTWSCFMPHDPDFVTVTPLPIIGVDPKLDLKLDPGTRKMLNSKDPRDQTAIALLPKELLEQMQSGKVELDPVNTLYIPRKTTINDFVGTSILCVSGDTLIQTEYGLLRIDEIPELFDFDFKAYEEIPLELKVNSHKKVAKTSHWIYTGEQETIKIKTDRGYSVEGTKIHPVLTLNKDDFSITWKKMEELEEGDLVAINRTPIEIEKLVKEKMSPLFNTSEESRDLVKFYPTKKIRIGSEGAVAVFKSLPETMTPELARILGYILAEGGVYKHRREIAFFNTDPILLDDFKQLWQKVFPAFPLTERLECTTENDKSCYGIRAHSTQLIDFFINMGMKNVKAPEKTLPLAIRMASKECLLAFFETFILGDGTVMNDSVRIYSSSNALLKEMQVALLSVGIVSRRKYRDDMGRLDLSNSQYFVSNCRRIGKFNNYNISDNPQQLNTLPRTLLKTLVPKLESMLKHESTFSIKDFIVDGLLVKSDILYYLKFSQEHCRKNKGLGDLEKLLPDIYANIKERQEENYIWEKIVDIEYSAEKKPVYDFCVPETTSFVGNGIVVHNTRLVPFWALEQNLITGTLIASRRRQRSVLHLSIGLDDLWEPEREEIDDIINLFMQADEDPTGAIVGTRKGVEVQEIRDAQTFWKLGDDIEFITNAKMRSLSVNEQFLSGEANYNTMDQALSVFMENVRALREHLTSQFFYRKAFTTLSRVYGLRKIKRSSLEHNIRIKKTIKENEEEIQKDVQKIEGIHATTQDRYTRALEALRNEPARSREKVLEKISAEEAKQIKESELLIPAIHWHKQLRPSADENFLSILSTMEEKGLPIPLRMWAGAGGIDLEDLVEMLDEDGQLRMDIQDWKRSASGDTATFASRIVGVKQKIATSLPLWRVRGDFMGVDKEDVVEYIDTFSTPARYSMLSAPKDVEFDLAKHFDNNSYKVEAMKFILKRIGMVNFPLQKEVVENVVARLGDAGLKHGDLIKEVTTIEKYKRVRKTEASEALKQQLKQMTSQPDTFVGTNQSQLYSGLKV